MSRALIQTAHARRLDKDKGAGERPPGTSAGHQGTVDGRLRLASGAKMPARPNTAVSVKGTDILHLPNEWALDGAKDLDEKDFLLGVVKQVSLRERARARARCLRAPPPAAAWLSLRRLPRAAERRLPAVRQRADAARPRRGPGCCGKQGVRDEVCWARAGRGPSLDDESCPGMQPHVQVRWHQGLRVLSARSQWTNPRMPVRTRAHADTKTAQTGAC
jgi:hypothetical protein